MLGGEKGVEILHPCGKGEIDMLKKMEMGTLVGRLEFIHMGHPCEEYNGEGYLLKIDFGEGRSKVGQPCGEIGLRWNRLSKKWVLGMTGLCLEGRKGLKYYTLVGRGRLTC